VIVVRGNAPSAKRYRIGDTWLKWGVTSLLLSVLLIGAFGVHYTVLLGRQVEGDVLRRQHAQLLSELTGARRRLAEIEGSVARVEKVEARLRALTALNDSGRNLALGPVSPPEGVGGAEPAPRGGLAAAVEQGVDDRTLAIELGLLDVKLEQLREDLWSREQSLSGLGDYLQAEHRFLSSIPSISPSRGWPTSGFGTRLDPYTGARQMHTGIDIAAPPGTPVHAPSDGLVVFAGESGGFGRTVNIDHGYDVVTVYGHLAAIHIKAGERVSRGQVIGEVGNSGRSTGPHLHYEVRVNGVPVDPQRYILD
jgi:murein DD-endopeptidase MepM/ murein hydrolase activator NlpD